MGKATKWREIFLVRIYRMMRQGLTDLEIAADLGVRRETLWLWRKQRAEYREMVEIVKREVEDTKDFPAWVYSRLSPELQKLWDKIEALDAARSPVGLIENMLADHGKRARQQLFLHALCTYGFSASQALAKVNVTKKELDRWIREDYGFAELVQEVEWHKANFFEEQLVNLVNEGNPTAVIFANKTFNRERGYANKLEVDHNHSGTVLHGVLDLSEIMGYLSPAAKLEVLNAIRKREEADSGVKRIPDRRNVEEMVGDQIAEQVREDEDEYED
jgi:hypothetical protein